MRLGILAVGHHEVGISALQVEFGSPAGGHPARFSHNIAQKKDFHHLSVFIERRRRDDVKINFL